MSFHNVRLVRKVGSPDHANLRPVLADRCKGSGWSLNSAHMQFEGSSARNAAIIAVLDRDSELRHDYLQRRWQGLIS
jgi:hypothetical protein